ncbi:unnamed protein product [Boreogadus saida]
MKAVYFLDNCNKDPRASRTVNDNAEEMASLNNNMAQCHQELQSMPLDLTETGGGLKFQAERPHLVSLGSGRLSTAVTLLPLAEGRTTLGHGSADIALQGPGVAAQHGYIENLSGRVTLHPCGNHCSVDGLAINRPVRLSQGRSPSRSPSLSSRGSHEWTGLCRALFSACMLHASWVAVPPPDEDQGWDVEAALL